MRSIIQLVQHQTGLLFHLVKQITLAAGLLFGTLCLGITGFMLIEDLSFVNALYMSVITMSTVGFTEVHPFSPEGRIFVTALIIINLSLFTYALSTLTSFIFQGGIKQILINYKVRTAIERLENHVVVCGFGRNGRQVCLELAIEHKPFVVIETNPILIVELIKNNYLFIEGDATNDDTLGLAGLHKASAMISTLPKDTDNLFIVLSARALNPALCIVSRCSSEPVEFKLKRAGCDHVVIPERIGGTAMADIVTHPAIVQFVRYITAPGNTDAFFEELNLGSLNNVHFGKSIKDIDLRNQTGVNIIGVRNTDGTFVVNPPADFKLTNEICLIVLGNKEQIQSLKDHILE